MFLQGPKMGKGFFKSAISSKCLNIFELGIRRYFSISMANICCNLRLYNFTYRLPLNVYDNVATFKKISIFAENNVGPDR